MSLAQQPWLDTCTLHVSLEQTLQLPHALLPTQHSCEVANFESSTTTNDDKYKKEKIIRRNIKASRNLTSILIHRSICVKFLFRAIGVFEVLLENVGCF